MNDGKSIRILASQRLEINEQTICISVVTFAFGFRIDFAF